MTRKLGQAVWWVISFGLFIGFWELTYALGLYTKEVLPPPHIFIAYLNLMRDGVEDPIETYVVNVGNATVGPDAAGMQPDGSSQP